MKKASKRDESIDHLLRSTFRSPAGVDEVRGTCVEPDVIAAWMEGHLSSAEATLVETHLATCAACQQVLAVFSRTEPPPATESLWQRWRLQWVVPIAAAATAVAIWVAVPDRQTLTIADNVTPAAPQPAPAAPPSESSFDSAAQPAQKKREAAGLQDLKSVRTQPAPEKETRSDANEADLFKARAAESVVIDSDAAPLGGGGRGGGGRGGGAGRTAVAEAPAAAPAPPAQNRALDQVQRQEELLRVVPPIEAVSPDPLVRWRIVANGRLERSTDAGKTWESVSLPETLTLVAVRALTPTTAIVAAADGRQFRTVDQGKTWQPFAD